MNLAFRLGALSALLPFVIGCGDDPIECLDGMVLEGSDCNYMDGGSMGGDLGPDPMTDGSMPIDGSVPTDEGPTCTPSGDVDVPDSDFEDTNCDGFDGDLELAVAVVPLGATAPTGIAASEATIADAITTAETEGLTQVWVASGDWTETVTLVAGISVYGGYDSSNDWQRTRALGAKSRVFGPGPLLVGEGIDMPTTVALIDFAADDAAAGESSIAARLVSSSDVRLEEVALESGRGGDGSQPARPAQADSGTVGDPGGMTGISTGCSFGTPLDRQPGGDGGDGCASCFAGGRGGGTSGGQTSAGTSNDGQGGEDGSSFMLGGVRTCTFDAADNGGPAPSGSGTVGATGAVGDPGAGAVPGSFMMGGFVAGDGGRGGLGERGEGGGGGGAAADVEHPSDSGCVYFGASGGGGGGGGCGGARGPGGTGGGASVALWLWDTTVTLVSVTLITSDGGDGGDGTRGGAGGSGGPGGAGGVAGSGGGYPGFLTFQSGGMGGPGGPGGEGGAGGGGAGGPSIGIVFGGDSSEGLTSMDIDFELGAGGAAGLGAGSDNDGAAGDSLERFDPEG